MKLLDRKGRLFGRINIVDFFIIVLICVIIPTFFYTYKILGLRPDKVPSTWVKVKAVTFVTPGLENLIKEGDISYDIMDKPSGKIVKIFKRDKDVGLKLHASVMKAKELSSESPSRYANKVPVYAEIELLCTQSGKNEPWYYNREPLYVSVNRIFYFSANDYSIEFFATNITPKEPETK